MTATKRRRASLEDEIVRLAGRADVSARKYSEKLRALRARLKSCQHKHTVTYQWEHDNGYGRQSMVTGRRCLSCQRRCPWPSSSNWSSPEDVFSD